jgi:hypothetical protein
MFGANPALLPTVNDVAPEFVSVLAAVTMHERSARTMPARTGHGVGPGPVRAVERDEVAVRRQARAPPAGGRA